jgi:cell division protein FtsL
MASAARAYEPLWGTAAPRREDPRRERFEVVPGKGRPGTVEAGVSPLVIFAFKVGVVILMFLCVVGLATVWLEASTVEILTSTSSVESAISTAREAGSNLEVQYSVLVNPTRIKTIASESLGMSAPTTTATLDLSGVVGTSDGDATDAGTSTDSVVTVSADTSAQVSTASDQTQTSAVTATAAETTTDNGVTSNSDVFKDAIGSTTVDGSTGTSSSL